MKLDHKIISIVGLGPRGVTVLERLVAILKSKPIPANLTVHIFDKMSLGEGVHQHRQPYYLLVNTVASQITFYSDVSIKQAGPESHGPSFYQWVKQQGYRLSEDNYSIVKQGGREIQENDYLPRALLGEYLHSVACGLIQELKTLCNVVVHLDEVVAIKPITNKRYVLRCQGNVDIISHYLLLTTGHSTNCLGQREQSLMEGVNRGRNKNPNLEFINNPYPISKLEDQVNHEMHVAIEGFGLTAFDILSAITLGKGGQFIKEQYSGKLKYIKSGKEPRISIYSLDGLPLAGRAVNQKGVSVQYKAKFLTVNKIDYLRKIFGVGSEKQLDFDKHVLPEILKDMIYVYYTTYFESSSLHQHKDDFSRKFIASDGNLSTVDSIINVISKNDQFNWNKMIDPMQGIYFSNETEYQSWFIHYLTMDYAECLKGNVKGAYKASCDVLRDIRDNIRYAVDFSGLTPDSHKRFLTKYTPIMNRLSVGPPKERIAELLAYIEAGIVDVFVGPEPSLSVDEKTGQFLLHSLRIPQSKIRTIDKVIKARIAAPIPAIDESKLMRENLLSGFLQPYYNGEFHPGGIAINKDLNPITRKGHVLHNVWALGVIAEGAKYYTYIVPRAGVNSIGIIDAARAVSSMIKDITQPSRKKLKLCHSVKSSKMLKLGE